MNKLTEQTQSTVLHDVSEKSPKDPFKILITTILSQRTRDQNTRKASNQLFSKYPNIESLAKSKILTVEKLIRPSGFYHSKARSIISVSKKILKEHDGKVPRNLNELLELESVGRKTANCVLAYGFHMPAIPVDTHVYRITNRLGIVSSRTPEETEIELNKKIKKYFWLSLNEEFVKFGQRICRPIRPRCLICKLRRCCEWYQDHLKVEVKIWSAEVEFGKLKT